MTPELRDRIQKAREAIASSPIGVLAGEVRSGGALPQGVLGRWSVFREFLSEADGGRYGSIDIWSFAELTGKQYPSVDFPGSLDGWLVFGQLLYEPLALRAGSDAVFLFRRGGDPGGLDQGNFDEFFERNVLGPGYKGIVPDGDQDEWWSILGQAGLL